MKIPFSRRFLQANSDLHGFIEYTSPGTYYFQLKYKVKARIILLTGGNDRFNIFGWSAGASGTIWIATARVFPGTYSVQVGTIAVFGQDLNPANSVLKDGEGNDLVNVYNGRVSSGFDVIPGSVEEEFTYNPAQGSGGGASPYRGYGKGSDIDVSNATTGYFSLEW